MTTQPTLTDIHGLALHRQRANANAIFLQIEAANEIQDRLEMVNRTFTAPCIVTPFPSVWSDRFPGATVVSDAETLQLDEQAHDLVVHALGLHWANDPVGQLIQCRRALKPDGMLLAVALGGQTLAELRRCLAESEITVTGGLSPRVAPMAEIRDLGALLQRAGLALPVADSQTLTVEYRDAWHLMRDLRAMGENNALSARNRANTKRAIFEHAAKLYETHFSNGSNKVVATFELVYLTGWAHDPGQPKALRPGSANQRLADALNTQETPLFD